MCIMENKIDNSTPPQNNQEMVSKDYLNRRAEKGISDDLRKNVVEDVFGN